MVPLRINELGSEAVVDQGYPVQLLQSMRQGWRVTNKDIFELQVVLAVTSSVHNLELFQECDADLDAGLEAEWLIPLFQNGIHGLTKLLLDEIWPKIGLIIVKGVTLQITLIYLLVRDAELRIKNHNFSFSEHFREEVALTNGLSILGYGNLRIELNVICLVLLCEFENDGLIYLALFTGIDDVHQVHTWEYQSVWAFTEGLVDKEPVIYEESPYTLDNSNLISIFIGKFQ